MLQLGFIGIFVFCTYVLAWFLVNHDRGPKEPLRALWEAAGFGALAVPLAFILELFLPRSHTIPFGSLRSLLFFLAIGVIEEGAKFLPLAAFIHRRSYFDEHTDGVIYFALAGLSFGLLENIAYTLRFGTQAALLRIILVLFFHASTSAVVGFYFARQKLQRESSRHTAVVLVVVMLMHGLYDFGLSSQQVLLVPAAILITVLFNIAIFYYYQKAGELDQAMGIAASGVNRFCRRCGLANPHRELYCVRCGQPT